ncbi:DUF2599 domain-containing protein [Glutamicibacter halophytocola]|uniref:DUF2599 domain-containing protein n=1 Tax=Glutamicibacter halophytocola TaxID=1933880 RepID=A0ABX5Y9R0_9MICC|nr:DUF2599 domain-containing protein [Glutamicibacter halophytocola]
MNHVGRVTCAIVATLFMTCIVAPLSHAEEVDSTNSALATAGEMVTDQNFAVTKTSAVFVADSEESSVVITTDPEKPVVYEDSATTMKLHVRLPNADKASQGKRSELGGVTFDNFDDSTSTVLPKTDGSLQIATVIESSEAPNEYEYTVTSKSGGEMVLERDGSVSILDENGEWEAGVARPWAKDANGNEIPTEYRIDGDKLIQHVAFDNDTDFPVVADPWLGYNLISKTSWAMDLWQYSPTLKVYPTSFGRYHAGLAARWAAWSETLSKTTRKGWPNPDTTSMKNQFLCHFDVVRLRAPNKEYWGLDSRLPNRGYWGHVKKNCN